MHADFWRQRWAQNEIPFHEAKANPLLVRHFPALALPTASRVFLPLCGKTSAIHWLLANGYRVAGAELSALAIEQLFQELGIEPAIAASGELRRYSAASIDIFVGDFFELSRSVLGRVDAVYDRAALVALPETMRAGYVAHLTAITERAPQLLICFEYDQRLLDGPPFSVNGEEVRRHYRERYDLTQLASVDVAGGLKGKCPALETVWLLQRPRG